MRVLLIGEASGVHRYLKRGLTRLGVDCIFITHSTPFSWEENDATFAERRDGVLGGVSRNLAPFLKIAQLPPFDVINFCQSLSTVLGKFTRYRDLPLLRRKGRVLSYYGTGCDEIGLIRRNPGLPYRPCDSCLASKDDYSRGCEIDRNPIYETSQARVREYFDFGASSMVEYGHVEPLFDHFRRIQLPVDGDKIGFEPARDRPVTRIVHTPTRRGFKGSAVVLAAIDRLRSQRGDFEFSVIEGLSYPEYLAAMRQADIVIDQVHSQSSGMNGLEMMAAGKVVLTGATELGRSYFSFGDESPAFDAPPDPASLAATLSSVLDRKPEFPAIAQASRDYVLKHHDPRIVAQAFVDGWREALQAAGQPSIRAR